MMPGSGHHVSDAGAIQEFSAFGKRRSFKAASPTRTNHLLAAVELAIVGDHVSGDISTIGQAVLNFLRSSTRITIIGDTHMRHDDLGTLRGDVLIHVGDMFDLFNQNQNDLRQVDDWYARQRFDLILCIAGNHDFALESYRLNPGQPFENAVYLQDETYQYQGINFYGTPWVPDLRSHAFYAENATLKAKWSAIPAETDVLITHTPPAGILDRSSRGIALGCPHLKDVVTRVTPKIHCFGHVHASGGSHTIGGTKFINASSMDRQDGPLRRPVKLHLPSRT